MNTAAGGYASPRKAAPQSIIDLRWPRAGSLRGGDRRGFAAADRSHDDRAGGALPEGAAPAKEQVNLLANTVNRTRRRDVQELRVVRNVKVYRAEMEPLEREAYDAITAAVHEYAWRRDIPAGFLLATPQRLLASAFRPRCSALRMTLSNSCRVLRCMSLEMALN